MNQKEFWNKQALDFPRYNDMDDEFQQKLINIFKEKNMLSKDSTVIDIGCGTGVYTIPIAKEAKKVLALDISPKMLEILKEDSWNYNLTKTIEIKCSNWSEFQSEEKYDLVFASLSAAFRNNADFEKILDYAKGYVCFLDFVDTKGSNFEELLSSKLKIKKQIYKDLENIKQWLNSKNIEYKTIPLTNNYTRLIDIDSALMKVKEVIEFSGNDLELSDDEILILLKPLMIGNKVNFVFNMKLELVWSDL